MRMMFIFSCFFYHRFLCFSLLCVCVCFNFLVFRLLYISSVLRFRDYFFLFQLVLLLQMIVIISISYVVCLCLDFLLSFVSSWFAFTRDVLYKERKLVSLFGDLEGLSFPAMKESMIFNIVLLSKQYRKDVPPSGYDSFFFS